MVSYFQWLKEEFPWMVRHHVRGLERLGWQGISKGLGMKIPDCYTIPLHPVIHHKLHAGVKPYADPEWQEQRLWENWRRYEMAMEAMDKVPGGVSPAPDTAT